MEKKKIVIRSSIIAASIIVLIVITIFIRAFILLESKKEILNYKNATASIVLSEEGRIIGKIFTENRTNINFEEIPDHVISALIATEDVRFYRHKGVDIRSLFRVLFKTILLRRESSGGGSTLTQQLAKNMFGRISKGPFALPVNKVKEAVLARRIEKLFTKNEIITLYLNTVPFGENVYGIEAASLRYYNKKINELRIEESAVLIGMLKANNVYNPRINPGNAGKRRNVVLALMQKYGFLEKDVADSLSRLPVHVDYVNLESGGPADYFIYQIKAEAEQILKNLKLSGGQEWNLEEDGLVISTTLNLKMQESANEAFQIHLSKMQKRLDEQYKRGAGKRYLNYLVENELRSRQLSARADEIGIRQIFDWEGSISDSLSISDSIRYNLKLLQAGMVALDPRSGAIRVWMGGIDYKTQPYDQVLARRQMGSTLKPIIYAAAFEEGRNPCDYLDNDSITLEGYADWHPANFDHRFGGKYSITGALVHSMNIPTLHLFLETGFGKVNDLWKNMGFSFDLVNSPALAMGTAESDILELAVAYAAFANGGIKISPYSMVSIKSSDGNVIWENKTPGNNGNRILSERSCVLINTILQKAVTEGTGASVRSAYGVNLPLAGKTGTTQDYTDAWFASYNPSIVMISRVGASLPSIHFNNSNYGTGSALALPLVALALRKIQQNGKTAAKIGKPFPEMDPEFSGLFDCPPFRDEDVIDEIRDFFTREESIRYDTLSDQPAKRKRSFFRRVFRRSY